MAEKFPSSNALHINGRYHTYNELLNIADSIRESIPEEKKTERIAVYCNDDVYTYASILAVNMYGAAYIPLNKKYPAERNRSILQESRAELILSSAPGNISSLPGGVKVIDTKAEQKEIISARSKGKVADQDLCYILFTSGTTSEPKGVPVTHENANAFFNYFLAEYDFSKEDKFLQTYELTFDVSVFSFFMPLLTGGCCYVLPDEGIKPMKIIEWLQKHGITVISMVPGVLQYLEKYLDQIKIDDLRYSFFSGDALYHELAVKWKSCLPNGKIHNFYGPAETTIVCTRYVFQEDLSAIESVNGIVPLGKAFPGMGFIIVDEEKRETLKGELCFSGDQVIPAYLNGAYEDLFFLYKNERYYRTGDIASLNSSGDLVFHGRADSQVKINGYRVELAEVENILRNVSGLACKVLSVKENSIERLVAFCEAESINPQSLKEEMQKKLPPYMVPQSFIAVKQFPLNNNGKADRKALINMYI
jgi:amino acid adenylation domain-containing protein